jgi:hypothetical protein
MHQAISSKMLAESRNSKAHRQPRKCTHLVCKPWKIYFSQLPLRTGSANGPASTVQARIPQCA